MDPFVLKIAVLKIFMCFNFITLSESMPLRQRRSSIVDWADYNSFQPQGFGTYSFGYDIEDPEKDNIQFRDEERFPNGTVRGSYGYLRPDGLVHMVHYTADKEGYRATVEDYPRGQLKPLSTSLPQTTPSSALLAALKSNGVYKKQHVHEHRQRPVDTNRPQDITVPFFTTAGNINYIDDKELGGLSNLKYSNGVRIQYVRPKNNYL